ncbi:helix-turn-helix transcriptional regulator [Micromonospora sp. NPDC050980]|uniref:helix-turn-helix domain-containing protein n=1 Tax=Micromonospora sp. NPDC050980 TaxID=3155161 RepID=UPI0033D6345A
MDIEVWIRALKAARAGAEVSQEALAATIRWSPSTIAAIETGRRRPTMEFAVAADQALRTGGLLANLLSAGEANSGPGWFEPWPGHEERAVRLCYFELCLIPGPLQTEEYARAVVSAGGVYRSDRVEELVSRRLERQRLLHREDPPDCVFLIDESALRRPVGGPAAMDRQLGRLLEVVELPHVRLHVLPVEVGAHVSMGGGFVLAEMPDGDRLLCLDNAARGQIADYPEWIALVQRKWEHLLGEALSERASVELVNKLKVTP